MNTKIEIDPETNQINDSFSEDGTTIMKNQGGEVKLLPGTDAEISFQIPSDHSALGVMSRNPVGHGEVFAKDYWVYRDGKKIRKWFSYCEGWDHFWEPCLDNLSHLESVHHKLKERATKRWAMMTNHLNMIMTTTEAIKGRRDNKCWPVHAQPYLPQNQQEGQCWVYEVGMSYFDKKSASYVMDWVNIPNEFRHLDLGNRIYALEQLGKAYLLGGVGQALDAGIKKFLKAKYSELNESKLYYSSNKMFEVRINGRHYVYRTTTNGYGIPVLEKHIWAGEEYNIVEV